MADCYEEEYYENAKTSMCKKCERIFTKLSMVFEGIIVYTIQRIYNTALHNAE